MAAPSSTPPSPPTPPHTPSPPAAPPTPGTPSTASTASIPSTASTPPAPPAPPPPRPTEAELAILQVLWGRGPSTVRDVQTVLAAVRPTGYTTVLKLLQIMFEKKLVRRDESERTHVYEAALSEESTQNAIVGDLLDRVFRGSRETLLLRALSAREASPGEIGEIRRLLDQYEEKEGEDP